MCGILGIATNQTLRSSELRNRIRAMGLWQYHRGPDGWGEWIGDGIALGQNRLAILDLVHGKQPMASADESVQVVFNGEIYNFSDLWTDLASKGYQFRTDHSDTEVIVHGYSEWGSDLLNRLEGMFAIAIWDASTQSLLLARDRLGIKPLYYALTKEGVVFASEPKTILASGWIKPELCASALPDFFMFRAPVGPATLFEGIKKLSAGCWVRFDRAGGMGVEQRYWEPRASKDQLADQAIAEERVGRAVGDAALSHLAADVPVGLFLSGGVDSSLLAALVAQHSSIEAFTVGTRSKLDESRFASEVASHLGLPLHVRWVTGDDFRSRFDHWCFFNDDPVADPSALALMLLAEHARLKGMKVMLAGEGADELFGGYDSYVRYKVYSLLARNGVARYRHALRRVPAPAIDRDYLSSLTNLRFYGSAHVMQAHDRRSLFNENSKTFMAAWEENAFAGTSQNGDPTRSAMLFDQIIRLPNDLLPRTDRATMAYSLEARVPYLDRQVVETANALSSPMCVRLLPPQGKWILKRIAAKHVPRGVVYRRKRGFNLPVEEWLSTDFADRVNRFLSERLIEPLNYDYLTALYRDHARGNHRAALLWAWLVLEQWYRLWIEGEATRPRPAIVSDPDAYQLLVDANESRSAVSFNV
jgi:asparagine synthase (glutamine-hydrolysing)